MQNLNSENTESQKIRSFQDVKEQAKGMADETSDKLRDLSGDLQDRYGEFWDRASGWLDENRSMAVAGAVVAVGVLSFFVGRSLVRSRNSSNMMNKGSVSDLSSED